MNVAFSPHQRIFFFETDRDYYRKPQPINTQSCGAESKWTHIQ